MATANPITAETLRQILEYDPATGVFRWKIASGKARCGAVAGTPLKKGYIKISYSGRQYLAHRLAWLYVHGAWPLGLLDHRNEQKTDNRITNLRDVTDAVNKQNVFTPTKRNKFGLRGVSQHACGKYEAQIHLGGVRKYLGLFATPSDAYKAYLDAKKTIHPGGAERC